MRWSGCRSKIVCTIGPASDKEATLRKMIQAGMRVARINLAHGTPEEHGSRIQRIRRAALAESCRLAILADLPGPKIRIGVLPEPMRLKRGDRVLLAPPDANPDKHNDRLRSTAPAATVLPRGTALHIPLELPPLARPLRPGDSVFLSDGFIVLNVEKEQDGHWLCRVQNGGVLLSHKGVNLPAVQLEGGAFTDRDRDLAAFALAAGVDALSVSFVEKREDIEAARRYCRQLGHDPFIVAKIERKQACKRIDEILEAADAIMVARGDLGVETPIEGIAILQKRLIRKARAHGKPVITATQMLESMVQQPRPTRAEATDVANAILDGTDAVMLSEESAMGEHPVLAVRMLARIAQAVEDTRVLYAPGDDDDVPTAPDVESVVALQAANSARVLKPLCIVTPTESGASARRVARYRLRPWIIALCPREKVCQELAFSYGVHGVHMASPSAGWEFAARAWLRQQGKVRGRMLLTQGPSQGHPGGTNRLEIIDLESTAIDLPRDPHELLD
ncbi:MULTISPECIES: pyruvate kinase [Acidithiobacillus]|jgi:pyruvate kinase|uniref:Pyruvate kinase n=3 Tax=Acidithiobacillus caldus TaxID=33059 RepID=F9ZND6_ACICS|nr:MULTISPECIES: pyruvate kinase [Acidithiobacillus]AEK58179.1 Pyruvate kinase [Acidithiobacillus caldus SM-1]AIA55166.1 Pyruvate kinase [Acidithiobacillus caldus ATCC 51756]AUW32817.1 pyruvate kinase [Acidithiobacillus caldus]MBU2729404.1 pyruvate kinase [Acidithiobacillus caldus]MBU2735189.1 pyruvate kinase [Acidithiobacillus caldus ATCC 51756]